MITALFATFLGIALLFISIKTIISYSKTSSWVKTPIQLKEVTIEKRFESDLKRPYAIAILYSYKIDGHFHSSSKVHFEEVLGSIPRYNLMSAKALKIQLQSMKTAFAYVNPNNPNEAFLFKQNLNWYYIALIGGIFALLFGGVKLYGLLTKSE